MSGSTFGTRYRVTTWGESHGVALGAVVDGCPPGMELCEADIQPDLDLRRPGQSRVTTQRKESDRVEILSGLFEGRTTGTPISMIFRNEDADPSKYDEIRDLFRPGHADYTYLAKYGLRDHRGGGRASARETAARVAAGAIARKFLAMQGIRTVAFIRQIGQVAWEPPEETESIDREDVYKSIVRCPDAEIADRMIAAVDTARRGGDSLGGIVEVRAAGVPPGLGEPTFDKLDADLAKAMMSIHAVKGVEIGSGFRCASMTGFEHNDALFSDGGKVEFRSNWSGGVLGGISTGQDIVVRLGVKPASSILREQETVDIHLQSRTIRVEGRHDPCVCPRAVVVAEAMLCIALMDHWLRRFGERGRVEGES
ncbi:MAG: chorismate synthase [Nitrospinota bacterium]